MRFPRKCSVNHHTDFIRIRKTGLAKAGRFVIVSTLADPALPSLRAAFITSKRAAKKAHDRTLIRRRMFVCACSDTSYTRVLLLAGKGWK